MDSVTPEPGPVEPRRRIGPIVRAVPAVLVVAAVAVFAAQNTDRVEVEFLGWAFRTPQILLMLASALGGIVVWEAIGALRRRSRRP